MHAVKLADQVRAFVQRAYIAPARARGESQVTVIAGDVHREMRLVNRIPAVCSALRSSAMLERNNLRIIRDVAPPSGLSSTVAVTYELRDGQGERHAIDATQPDPLLELRGVARDLFASLGGGEGFIRRERRSWEEDEAGS